MVDIIKIKIVITTSTPEKSDGLNALDIAIEKIKETILKLGGTFSIQMAVRIIKTKFNKYKMENSFLQPKVVTAIDEADLARRLERAEMENAQVSGDEDESDEEEGMKFDGETNEADKDSNKSESDEEQIISLSRFLSQKKQQQQGFKIINI